MQVDLTEIEVVSNVDASRFEAHVGDELAFIAYSIVGDDIIFSHTEVPVASEGQGIAGKMARTALEFAKENEYRVFPACSYVSAYIEKHPEYQPLAMER